MEARRNHDMRDLVDFAIALMQTDRSIAIRMMRDHFVPDHVIIRVINGHDRRMLGVKIPGLFRA